jgi:hypothetical protein
MPPESSKTLCHNELLLLVALMSGLTLLEVASYLGFHSGEKAVQTNGINRAVSV